MPHTRESSGEHRARRLARQRRNRRIARVGGAMAGGALVIQSLLNLTAGYETTLLTTYVVLLLSVVVFVSLLATGAWRWSRMRAELAQEVLAEDARPPVVYLRPFEADRRERWYERRIARAVKELGPVITVGRPQEELPATPYMAREYLLEDEWQARVLDLIDRAQLLILSVGTSAGVVWELEQVVRLERPERLVLCLGSDAVPRIRANRNAGALYRTFCERFARMFPKGLPADPRGSAFVAFARDWTPSASSALTADDAPSTDALRRLHHSLTRVRIL